MTPTVLLALEHLLLLVICITGDKLGDVVHKPPLLRAVIDNITHALIGGLVTEIIVRDYKDQLDRNEQIALIAVGFVLSSWIDFDHFIEAKSFHLHDATSLTHRPFLHNSMIFVALFASIITSVICQHSLVVSLWLSVGFVAFFTHQIRDAIRRGLWFRAPHLNYSTAPVLYWVYLALEQLCAHAMIQLLALQQRQGSRLGTESFGVKYKPLEVV